MSKPGWSFLASLFITALVGLFLCLTAADPPDYRDVPPAELGIELVKAKKDPKTGFVIGGKNPTALIRGLKEINGRIILELEKDMRPGAPGETGSQAGFLGKDESLLAVLAADNAYVVDDLGLTHQALARPLRVVAAVGLKQWDQAIRARKQPPADPIIYHGRRFSVTVYVSKGFQWSPFLDGTKTNVEADVMNVDTGKKLRYSLLVPDMIERYGFYEGKGTMYRVDPRQVLEVFDFLKPR
jgi:hypothetical protein